MRKISAILCLLSFILTIATVSYAIDLQKMMRDYLGRGYSEASQGSRIQAKKYFRKAFDLAKKVRDWSGMIDAASGLLALGDSEEALKCFDSVEKMNKRLKDWRASIALSYNYLSFPKGLVDKQRAIQSAEKAQEYASEKKDPRGLLETAKLFNKMGMKARSQELIELADEYKDGTGKLSEYPPDFKPYGETVTGPEKIDTAAQVAQRQTIDQEIAAKLDYLARSEEMDKQKSYYTVYTYYYDYPYYYRYYSIYDNIAYLPPDWLGDWAYWNLNRYRFVDGSYIFLGW